MESTLARQQLRTFPPVERGARLRPWSELASMIAKSRGYILGKSSTTTSIQINRRLASFPSGELVYSNRSKRRQNKTTCSPGDSLNPSRRQSCFRISQMLRKKRGAHPPFSLVNNSRFSDELERVRPGLSCLRSTDHAHTAIHQKLLVKDPGGGSGESESATCGSTDRTGQLSPNPGPQPPPS